MFNKDSRYHPLEEDGSKATQANENVMSSATGNPPKAASKFELEPVETTGDPEYAELKPTIGIFSGSALIVGLMIGSGIFSTPGTILSKVGSPGMAMILWAFGGVITYAGTISYVELGTMIPKNGGEQAYLAYAFKKPRALIAFLFCWAMIVCIRPGSEAADSNVFAKYILYAAYGPQSEMTPNTYVSDHYDWILRGISLVGFTIISITTALSTKAALRVIDVLTILKLLTLALISITGIVALAGGIPSVPNPGNWNNSFAGTKSDGNGYAIALFKIFWTYDGWNNLNYSIGELKNPTKNLPIAASLGVGFTTALYILTNIAYFAVVPKDVALNSAEILAGNFTHIVFGFTAGRVVIPIFIAFSAYGAVSNMVFSGGRILLVAAREGYVPFGGFIGKLHPTFGTPVNAIAINWIWAVVLMLAPPPGEVFDFMTDLVGYPSWIFYGISVFGLIYLRFKEPNTLRPFKAFIPGSVLFILTSVFLAVFPFVPPSPYPAHEDIPFYLYAVLGVLFIIIGIPVWYFQVVAGDSWRHAINRKKQLAHQLHEYPGVVHVEGVDDRIK
ncbi:amino acid/polyamine transporter I [Endogone sp. FLAS-F59071]|nr:amino acid/polyamine transporter I [Endogone sp. FLAS-F59071]|eukprot:RUS19836.1 amino acid/polyamine transporter I [Endogone sp. FLAS-F59071]